MASSGRQCQHNTPRLCLCACRVAQLVGNIPQVRRTAVVFLLALYAESDACLLQQQAQRGFLFVSIHVHWFSHVLEVYGCCCAAALTCRHH
jgi:hypothetical protein